MPRELITIQVGQCGNQIGRRFWQMALEEHATFNSTGNFDEAMSTFFRNVDTRYGEYQALDLPVGDGTTPIGSLRARAVLVDMEDGPMTETLRGPLGDLFDESQLVRESSGSGSGNNWAQGFYGYGPSHEDGIVEALRRSAEMCDSLQSFFLMHSLGGGTGSGLGTYILSLLGDNFPGVHRFATSVFPSVEQDDVITSPYNAALACKQLSDHADCVLPVDNSSLTDMAAKVTTSEKGGRHRAGSHGSVRLPELVGEQQDPSKAAAEEGFNQMNDIAARMLTHLTSSMRFPGDLNVDLNEITTNLVPFPRLQYILASFSPLHPTRDERTRPRHLKQMFSDTFSATHQLMRVEPRNGTVLACAMLMRGDVPVSDVTANIDRLQSQLKMIYWNREGFKIGLCSTPPVGHSKSLLCLSNNSCISLRFKQLQEKFSQLYHRKAMVHHYTQLADEHMFTDALSNLEDLIADYEALHASEPPDESVKIKRLVPAF